MNKLETFSVLVDQEYRKKNLKNPNIVYEGGVFNTRKPLLTKQSGMGPLLNLYFLPEVQQYVISNETVYKCILDAYNVFSKEKIVKLYCMPERLGLKVPTKSSKSKTGSMIQHLDSLPSCLQIGGNDAIFKTPSHVGDRIQAFVTYWLPHFKPEGSGTLQVIPCFHKYWELFSEFIHPDSGFKDQKREKTDFAFLCMEPKLFNLKLFNSYIAAYTAIANKESIPKGISIDIIKHARGVYEKKKIQVPSKPITLKWKAIEHPRSNVGGHLYLWDSTLPHKNSPMSSACPTPRGAAYVDFRGTKQFSSTKTIEKIKECFEKRIPVDFNSRYRKENDYERKLMEYYDGVRNKYPNDKVTENGKYSNAKCFKNQHYKSLFGF